MSKLRTFGRNLLKSREQKARGMVYAQILGFDDEIISKAGFSREELQKHATTTPMI